MTTGSKPLTPPTGREGVPHIFAVPSRLQQRWAALLAWCADTIDFFGLTAWPVLDIAVRGWVANRLVSSGVMMAADWTKALALPESAYPAAWLGPQLAIIAGILIETACGLALVLGLGTRLAALGVLAVTALSHASGQANDQGLIVIALMAGYVLRGPGPIALDHILGPGVARSPLPFAATLAKVFDATRSVCSDGYLAGLRVWLMLTLLLANPAVPQSLLEHTTLLWAWMPVRSAAVLFGALGLALALMLGAGAATRMTALAVIAFLSLRDVMIGNLGAPLLWSALMAILLTNGPGAYSLDGWLLSYLKRRFPEMSGKPAFSLDGLPHVVIVGAGFGGIACAKGLRHAPVKLTLIDRHNYHLFQPLLYQVATAALSPGDIAVPVRSLLREQFNAQVLLATVTGIDTKAQRVIAGDRSMDYDYLVLATGSSHSYFGKDAWAEHAPGLKRIDDATAIRRRILEAFERAELAQTETERARLLNFVVVGGGPTGVELAGAIAELARYGMDKDFRNFDPANANVVLVQSGPRLLPSFPEALSQVARKGLEDIGVSVRLNSRAEQIDADGIVLGDGERIYSRSVLWAAGVSASPAAAWLGATADAAGRVVVGDDLSVPALPNVFVIGDTAASNAWGGKPVPGLAPAAKQSGTYVAKVIRARLFKRPSRPFAYHHLGSMATIGRKTAVADFGPLRLSGALAWWLWGAIHVFFLVGTRNRITVILNWVWSYITFRASTRLITGSPGGE